MEIPDSTVQARDGALVFRGALVVGLLLTGRHGPGALHAAFLTSLPLVAGLVFGAARVGPDAGDRRVHPMTWLQFLLVWAATLSPLVGGNREMLRTCTLSGALAVLLYGGPRRPWRRILTLVGGAALTFVVAWALLPSTWGRGVWSEVQYALGGGWPRGWREIGRDAALVQIGCWMARGPRILAIGRRGGIALPFRALGSMPLTTAAVHFLLAALLTAGNPAISISTQGAAGIVGIVLLAQMVFAVHWLRGHSRGPCEEGARRLRAGAVAAARWARIWARGTPGHAPPRRARPG